MALNTAKEAVAEELETRGVGDRLGEDVGPVAFRRYLDQVHDAVLNHLPEDHLAAFPALFGR